MFCIKCGKEIPDGARFCPSCGQEVNGKVEEKVEKKSEKNIWKQGNKLPVWKKILIVLVTIAVIVAGYFIAIENWRISEIPNPQDFFGIEAIDTSGGFDINWHFESEWDSLPVIEKYAEYIEKTTDNIKVIRKDKARGNVSFYFEYEGFWLGNVKPSFRFSYYGNDYYGIDSSNRNYVFQFRAENNFKLVESECYAGDVSVDEIVNNNTPNNSQSESKEESEKVEVNPFALPDPCLFFNCGRNEDQKHDNGDAWLVSCKFDLDEGKNVVQEYIDLLESRYPLGRFDYAEEDYVKYTGAYFYNYYYRYTGTDINIPGFERDGRENTDVQVSLYYNYRSGFILVTFIYDNTFELVDCGEKASAIPTSFSGTPSNTDTPQVDFYVPEYAKQDCLMCDGTGDCQKCNGYGTVEYYNGDGEYVTSGCPTCYGNRKCRYCNGTGKREN